MIDRLGFKHCTCMAYVLNSLNLIYENSALLVMNARTMHIVWVFYLLFNIINFFYSRVTHSSRETSAYLFGYHELEFDNCSWSSFSF